MSLFHLITHLFNHSSYTPPHYHPSILISSYVIIPSHHTSVQPFILHTTSLSPIHSDILCHYSISPPICSTIHSTHHLTITHPFCYHPMSLFHLITHLFNHSSYTPSHSRPSILISSYVIIPSHHTSVQPFILHITSLSPIHSDIILCHYSIPSPICSTIHPIHHLTITHPF